MGAQPAARRGRLSATRRARRKRGKNARRASQVGRVRGAPPIEQPPFDATGALASTHVPSEQALPIAQSDEEPHFVGQSPARQRYAPQDVVAPSAAMRAEKSPEQRATFGAHTPPRQAFPLAQSLSATQNVRQATPSVSHAYAPQLSVTAAGQAPLPSQVAARVATEVAHPALRHESAVLAKPAQLSLVAPSQAIARHFGFRKVGEQMDEIDGLEEVFLLRRSELFE